MTGALGRTFPRDRTFGVNATQTVVGALTALALGLRLFNLDMQPLWWDEGYSVYFASQDLVTLTLKTASDIHPPLYYYLLHAWMSLAGPGPEAVRLLSVLLGTLIVPALFAVGRPCIGTGPALLAAALSAVSPMQVYYSQEVRMYALAALLGLASAHFAQRILFSPRSGASSQEGASDIASWAGYIATTALALYTLYYAAFIPLFQTLYVLSTRRRDRQLVFRWLAADAAIAVLFAPWVVLAGGILVNYVGAKMVVEARTAVGLSTYLWDHLAAFSVGHALSDWRWLAAIAPLMGLLALLGLMAGEIDRSRRAWLGCWVAMPLAAGFLLNLVYPFSPAGYQRFLLYSQPAFLLLAGLGAHRAWVLLRRRDQPRFAGAIAVLAVAAAALPLAPFYTTPRYAADDYRPIMSRIASLGHPDDAVLCVFPWQVGYIKSYLASSQAPRIVEAPEAVWSRDAAALGRDVEALLAGSRRLWFPAHQKHGAILEQQVEARLATAGFSVANDWFGDTRLYMASAGPAPDLQPKTLTFDGRLALSAASFGTGPAEAGVGVVPVDLRWRLDSAMTGDYVVRLRLVDSQGRTWAQRDSAPVAGSRPFSTWPPGEQVADRHGLLIPAGTPPGAYQLRLSVYAGDTSQSLTIADSGGGVLGPEVTLGRVQVSRSAFRPPIAALGMQRMLGVTYAGGPTLLGVTAPSCAASPGSRLTVSLYWQGAGARALPYIVFLQVQDSTGKPWALAETPDLGNGFTLDQLEKGEFARSQYDLLLPATIPDGEYRLVAGLLSPADRSRLPGSAGAQAELASLTVGGRRHTSVIPPMQHAAGARFGDVAELLGFDLEAAAGGRNSTVTLYWRALRETSTSYSVFVHLVDSAGTIAAQRDSVPQAGKAPTTSWIPGEVISDTYTLAARPGAAPGAYTLIAGLYVEEGGPRLSVETPGLPPADFLTLGAIEVTP